jgi:hypothetical protein
MSSHTNLFWISSFGYSSIDRGYTGAYFDGHFYSFGTTNRGSGGQDDFFVYKINQYGQIIWQKYIGAGNYEYGRGIDIDSSGNIYIVGDQSSDINKPMWTIKLNSSDGAIQWQRQITTGYSNNISYDLRCDSNGDVYWSGYVNSPATFGNDQMYLVKYNSSGTLQWTKTSSTGKSSFVLHVHKSTDDVYVAFGNNVSRFNSSGTLQQTIQFSTFTSNAGIRALYVDDSDNIYVGGVDSSWQGYIVKTNSSGTIQWQKKHSYTTLMFPNGIGIDNNGDVYMCGSLFTSSPRAETAFVFKYNSSNGNIIWKRELINSPDGIYINSKHIDFVDNSFYLTGSHKISTDPLNSLVAKLPIDGSLTGTYGAVTWQSLTSTTESTPSITTSTPSLSFGTLGSSSTSSLSISDASATQSISYL